MTSFLGASAPQPYLFFLSFTPLPQLCHSFFLSPLAVPRKDSFPETPGEVEKLQCGGDEELELCSQTVSDSPLSRSLTSD